MTPKTGILADLFAGPGNLAWELGRILTFLAMLYVGVGLAWNIWKGEGVDLAGLAAAVGAVLTGGAAYVGIKTWVIEKARQAALAVSEPISVEVVNEPGNAVPVTAGDER